MTDFEDRTGDERPQDVTAETEQVVRVSAFGTDAVKVPYVEDQEVQYYLGEAKLLPGQLYRRKKTYTLNGETVKLDTKVPSGAVIVVTNKVRNG